MQVMRTDVLSRLRRLSTSVRIAEYTDDDDDDDDTDGSRSAPFCLSWYVDAMLGY